MIKPLSKYLLITVICLLNSYASEAQTRWRVDRASVKFNIKNAGITVDGNFSGFEGNLVFSPDNLEDSRLEGSVDVNTIQTGIKLRDKDLKKEKYFHVDAYPRISLISQSFSKVNDSTFEGNFQVNMKGVKKEITFPFIFNRQDSKARFKANFTLNRQDFDVGGGSFLLANEVIVFLDIRVSPY